MFVTEIVGGVIAGSVSLHADAVDFLGDSFNYAISLAVIGLTLTWRARAALPKGATMAALGIWVMGEAAWHIFIERVPGPFVMGGIGTLALAANGAVLHCYTGFEMRRPI
jgi:Co/Zn/Cd efflux system component